MEDDIMPDPYPFEKTVKAQILERFQQQYHTAPAGIAHAPGRVNLIGEHTDYNEGFVLPMAIDRGIWIAFRPRTDRRVRLYSLDFEESMQFSLDALDQKQSWAGYVHGVAWALQTAGQPLTGWDGVVMGNVPIGAGLSSSAALELAVARVFAAVSGLDWQPIEMALLCQRAENVWVGVNCGVMDQLVSALGRAQHALCIDTRSLHTEYVPFPSSARIVVFYSDAPRSLAASAYNQRRAECEEAVRRIQALTSQVRSLRDLTPESLDAFRSYLPETIYRRARHVVTENARVLASVQAMRTGDLESLGRWMLASHRSLRDDYQVSSAALDKLVALAMDAGALGARLTGAGFGGCAIALCRTAHAEQLASEVIAAYNAQTGLHGEAYAVVASDGAGIDE